MKYMDIGIIDRKKNEDFLNDLSDLVARYMEQGVCGEFIISYMHVIEQELVEQIRLGGEKNE